MNKSNNSVDVNPSNYSALIDKGASVKGLYEKKEDTKSKDGFKATPKLKKEMFASIPDPKHSNGYLSDNKEENDPYFRVRFENKAGEESGLHQVLLEKEHRKQQKLLNRSSFEIQDTERQCLQLSERGNLWIILALLAGICYAFNNFFLGQLSHHGLVAVIYVNIPSFFLFMTVYSINLIRNKLVHGFYWSRDISIFFKEEDNNVDWVIILGVVMMSFCKFCGFCLVVLTFKYASAAGMNLGIITVIFNFCCITDSVVFYFVFNEKLSRSQLLGSGVLLLSAIFIAQKPGSSETTSDNYGRFPGESKSAYEQRVEIIEMDHYFNAMMAIGIALCSTLFFSARDVILRYYKVNKNYPAFELSLDSLTLYSFCCTLYALYLFGVQGYDFDWGSLSAGCMSAVLNTLGFMMLGISVVIGYAGPANALNSIQAVVLTGLSVMLMNQIPSNMQVTGMLLGMVGTIIVSVGDAILNATNSLYKLAVGERDDKSGDYVKLNN